SAVGVTVHHQLEPFIEHDSRGQGHHGHPASGRKDEPALLLLFIGVRPSLRVKEEVGGTQVSVVSSGEDVASPNNHLVEGDVEGDMFWLKLPGGRPQFLDVL